MFLPEAPERLIACSLRQPDITKPLKFHRNELEAISIIYQHVKDFPCMTFTVMIAKDDLHETSPLVYDGFSRSKHRAPYASESSEAVVFAF